MIKQIFTAEEFSALPEKGIEAGKIHALYNAYGTQYQFCRFYRQGDHYISALDGSFVLCGECTDYRELSEFLNMNGFAEVFCSEVTANALSAALKCDVSYINLMRFAGGAIETVFNDEPSLSEVYSIISEGFDIPFEPWYLDMSHRVRHGVTRCAVLADKASLVIQHDINGEALISQVACRKESRGKGYASQLVISVAASLAPSEVYVLCDDRLIPFYEKCGFKPVSVYCVLS